MSMMQQYDDLLTETLSHGTWQDNRTTARALTLPYGAMMRFDLAEGFPAVTTKRLHFAGIRGEIIGFLRGYTHADDFAALGCRWWHQDANENTAWLASPHRKGSGDLGRVYGANWRDWRRADGTGLDQVQQALDDIRNNPGSRRIIISAWRPDEFDQMALPPCHVLYDFTVDQARGELHLALYQRSADLFLGVPMNIAGGALMLHLFAAATGLRPRWLTHFVNKAHIYENAITAVHEQLQNPHKPAPSLFIMGDWDGVTADELAAIEPADIWLHGYTCTELRTPRVAMVTG